MPLMFDTHNSRAVCNHLTKSEATSHHEPNRDVVVASVSCQVSAVQSRKSWTWLLKPLQAILLVGADVTAGSTDGMAASR